MAETIFLMYLINKFTEVINASEFSLNDKIFSSDTKRWVLRSWSEDWEFLVFWGNYKRSKGPAKWE